MDYKGKQFDQVWQIKYVYRKFPRKGKVPKSNMWKIYGSVQNEGFDALSFSKQAGDYPSGGTPTGGNWERMSKSHYVAEHYH
jgi:hypothetical protein